MRITLTINAATFEKLEYLCDVPEHRKRYAPSYIAASLLTAAIAEAYDDEKYYRERPQVARLSPSPRLSPAK